MRKDICFSFQSTLLNERTSANKFHGHTGDDAVGFCSTAALLVSRTGFSSSTAPLLARYRSIRPQDHKSARMGLYKHLGPSTWTAISKSIMNNWFGRTTTFWGLMSTWAIPRPWRYATPSINWRLESRTSLQNIPYANARFRGVASGRKMNVHVFDSSDPSKGIVWLYDDLIEWRCSSISSS